MVDYATRPASLSGCWASWSETDAPQVIRSGMDNGDVKVRRRTTGIHRIAECAVRLPAGNYNSFMEWFRVHCQSGVVPTNIVEPNGTESIWRFMEAPAITWVGETAHAFEASCRFERLPGWQVI